MRRTERGRRMGERVDEKGEGERQKEREGEIRRTERGRRMGERVDEKGRGR